MAFVPEIWSKALCEKIYGLMFNRNVEVVGVAGTLRVKQSFKNRLRGVFSWV